LSAEIEADEKKIAELPGLIEKTQEEASAVDWSKPARGTTLRAVQYSKRLPGTTREYPSDTIKCL
jgi:hypothetical protein